MNWNNSTAGGASGWPWSYRGWHDPIASERPVKHDMVRGSDGVWYCPKERKDAR